MFFSGDTGLTTEYEAIREHFGPFDLVMLEIGAHHPAWGDVHLGPENALKALEFLGGGTLLPIHWGTFRLAMHAWGQPAETLLERAFAGDTPLLLPRIGEALEPAHGPTAAPWWREVDQEADSAAPDGTEKMPGDLSWPLD